MQRIVQLIGCLAFLMQVAKAPPPTSDCSAFPESVATAVIQNPSSFADRCFGHKLSTLIKTTASVTPNVDPTIATTEIFLNNHWTATQTENIYSHGYHTYTGKISDGKNDPGITCATQTYLGCPGTPWYFLTTTPLTACKDYAGKNLPVSCPTCTPSVDTVDLVCLCIDPANENNCQFKSFEVSYVGGTLDASKVTASSLTSLTGAKLDVVTNAGALSGIWNVKVNSIGQDAFAFFDITISVTECDSPTITATAGDAIYQLASSSPQQIISVTDWSVWFNYDPAWTCPIASISFTDAADVVYTNNQGFTYPGNADGGNNKLRHPITLPTGGQPFGRALYKFVFKIQKGAT